MEKLFNHKSFIYFVWTPLGSRVNLQILFCLQVHFKVSATRYCSHNFPPVSLTPVANLPPVLLIPVAICQRCQKIATGVTDTGGKFATGLIDTGSNFVTGVVDTGGAPGLEYLRKFSKNEK